MTYINLSRLLLLLLVLTTVCDNLQAQSRSAVENLIPKPVSVTTGDGVFTLTGETKIYVEGETPQLMQVAQSLADKLKPATGFALPVSSSQGDHKTGNIYLAVTGNDTALGDESYELSISKEFIKVTANKPAG
jgi:hexosaminidase